MPNFPWPLPVAILAGGLATRLKPITEKIPKALVPVTGRPFLAHQLELLQREGIRNVVLCVGHLGEMIEAEFGDGANYGVKIQYSFDGPKLLGTGGALKRAEKLLGDPFFVLYGDSYVPISFRNVAEAYFKSGRPALMTVFPNEEKWDTSNVWFDNGELKLYSKKKKLKEMRYIDYGLSILSKAVLKGGAKGKALDLADVLTKLSERGELAGYEVEHRFYEIGSHAGLEELNALLSKGDDPRKK